jgi:ubiquinol-cytochrome c reductase cytochrome b subunit
VIGRSVVRFVDERVRLADVVRTAKAKVFPDHWSFMLGEIALYSFLLLIGTGVFLTLFFEPSFADRTYTGSYEPLQGADVSAAFASTVEISWDVRAGLLMRQAHHWGTLIFVAAIVVHAMRIFFTGAFRRPRELNWIIGVTLLILAILNGFTGYSLPDDLLSGTGLRIASAVLLSIPVAGPWLQFLAFGGEFPGEELIERLYVTHVLLVPGLIAILLVLHIGLIVRQRHGQFPGRGHRERNVVGSPMWPAYAFRSLALFCAVAAVTFGLGGLAQINPIWLWGPFEPAGVTSPVQPDWYVAWVEGALRLAPAAAEFTVFGYLVSSVFIPAVVVPGLTFLGMYAWPWIERRFTRDTVHHHLVDRPRDNPVRTAIGVAVVTFYGVLLVAGANDVIARELEIPVLTIVQVLRVALVVVPLVAAVCAFVLARALRDSEAVGVTALQWKQITAAMRRNGQPVRARRERSRT